MTNSLGHHQALPGSQLERSILYVDEERSLDGVKEFVVISSPHFEPAT